MRAEGQAGKGAKCVFTSHRSTAQGLRPEDELLVILNFSSSFPEQAEAA